MKTKLVVGLGLLSLGGAVIAGAEEVAEAQSLPRAVCVGSPTQYVVLDTPPDTCGVTVNAANKLAGTCTGPFTQCLFNGQPARILGPGGNRVLVEARGSYANACTSYVIVRDRTPPTLTCPPARDIECTGPSTSLPSAIDVEAKGTCRDACGCKVKCEVPATAPLGTVRVACRAYDGSGNNAPGCETTLRVVDTRPPALSITASPAEIWPPNQRMIPIEITKTANDACDATPKVTCTAASNDGAPAADIAWKDGKLSLRATRGRAARVYTITCTATDDAGNKTEATATVTVPHDKRR
jgi:hypothetical protein